MKRCGSLLEFISCKAVCVISVILLAAFTYWAGIYTHMINVDLENLKIRLYEDSMIKNIGCLLGILLVLFFISKLIFAQNEETNKKRVRIAAIVCTVLAGVIGIIWVVINDYVPDHDQAQIVLDAMNFLKGDYSDLKGYLEIYPHQIGLVFLYEILFALWTDHEVIYFVHVLWIMVIVYFTYAVTEELFENSKISLYSVFGALLYVPMYFYVNYAYGDLSMASCGIAASWCLIKFCKSNQKKYFFCLLFILTFSYLARTNAVIVIIAMAIVLIVYGISKGNWKILLMSAALIVIPLGVQKSIVSYYEYKAEVEMVKGAPAVLHIAMGMQDTYEGPGYYNAYNLITYVNADKDADVASDIAKEYIAGRIQEMSQDPNYTKDFYLVKIWQQWNEPSFSGELSSKTFSEPPGKFVQEIYYGTLQNILRDFRNGYLFVLYAGAFVGAFCKLISGKEKEAIWKNVIFVILIGGFLFSILWENKSRYVMPYVAMLLPYGVYGLYQLQTAAGKAVQFATSRLSGRISALNR